MTGDVRREAAERARQRLRAAGRWLFGDRYGLALWLGLALAFAVTWRVGFFIQDTYATANTLVALADGQLHVTEVRYSLSLGPLPGLHEVDGRLYGRNYGQLALAVPLVWVLEAAATVVDPGLLLDGLWILEALAFVHTVSRVPQVDRRRAELLGTALVAAVFVATLRTATDLAPDRLALVAFQLSTLLAAATLCLLLYRLGRLVHDRRVGLAAGLATGLATPVGFWATIPKRHTLVAAMVVGVVYAFAVSRYREGRLAMRARMGAYALAGLVTWTHAFEGFFLVVVLGVVDLATARSRQPRQLLTVGLVLLVALTPMLATNYAISGNPAEPPRVLPGVDSEEPTTNGTGGEDAAGSESGESTPDGTPGGGDDRSGGGSVLDGLFAPLLTVFGLVFEFAGRSVVDGIGVLGQPGRLADIFVQSGHVPGVRYDLNDHEVVELALLEAMPVAGALAVLPVLAVRQGRERIDRARQGLRSLSPARQTDLLVCSLVAVLTVVYLPRLPLFSQLTVRYLHPVVPLAVYGLVRIPAVRDGLDGDWRPSVGAAAGWFTVVTLGMLWAITALDLAVGEAVQLHATVALVGATLWTGVVLGRTIRPEDVPRWLVTASGSLVVGVGTAYVGLSALVYFRYGRYALAVVQAIAAGVPSL